MPACLLTGRERRRGPVVFDRNPRVHVEGRFRLVAPRVVVPRAAGADHGGQAASERGQRSKVEGLFTETGGTTAQQ